MLRLIADHAERDPATVALLTRGRPSLTSTCAEIGEHAQIRRAIDFGKEDRVALLLPNGPEGALGFLANPGVCVCAPLKPMCTANELALSRLKPKLLIAWSDPEGERRAVATKHGMSVMMATPALEREAGVFTL
jgi:oxalate---CoA ligase